MMKKMITAALAVMMMATLTACGGSTKSASLEGTTTEIIEKVYEQKEPELNLMTMDVDISDEASLNSYTGLDSADKISEVSVSEGVVSAQAYSLVMVRVNDADDAKEVAEAMKSGINTRKWVCVEADDLAVAGYNDVVMLIMVGSDLSDVVTSAEMIDAFKTVCGGTLSFEL